MDFMKVFDQTVREIKREVNLKVLKVPEIEQKVLDATDNEPWGPHGTALAEIAQATKKFTECQMVMNVLWTRLGETGKDWRYVYKALAVIEYLIANGSERAVDDIIEHTFQISSLTSFEYTEPNGKDSGINVRKKAETIVSLLNDKDKIQDVRNKAAKNCEKYFGLSSTGITYKSGAASHSSSSFSSQNKYGGFSGSSDYDTYGYKDRDEDTYGTDRFDKYVPKSRQGSAAERKRVSSSNGSSDQDFPASRSSNPSGKESSTPGYCTVMQQRSSTPSNSLVDNDDDDDFDPRGTSTSKPASGSSQVDLFGQNLIGDLLDAPTSIPSETPLTNKTSSNVDLFADADFVSAAPRAEAEESSQAQPHFDLFASGPAPSVTASSTIDIFGASIPTVQPEVKSINAGASKMENFDPFAAPSPGVQQEAKITSTGPSNLNPVDPFSASDLFGGFTSHTDMSSSESAQNSMSSVSSDNTSNKPLSESKAAPNKVGFQVKSGIWADSLSRGLIDLNISAPARKVNLADVGVVGGLSDGLEQQKGPFTSNYMGRSMGIGSGLGMTSAAPSATGGSIEDIFSSFSNRPQFHSGAFQK